MKVLENSKKVLYLLFISFFAIAVVTSGAIVRNTRTGSETEASSACKCTDDDVCYPDGCTRKPKTEENTFDEERYGQVCDQYLPSWPPSKEYQQFYCSQHQPDCCQDMVAYQDSRLCCFMERWHCHPNYCNQLQGDKGDCGKYWGLPNGFNEYGCVKKDANGEKIPKYGVAPNVPGGGGGSNPTSTPQPTPTTQQQQPSPTPQNNVQPTATPQAVVNPTATPGSNQSGVTRFPIVLPSMTPTRTQSNNPDNSLGNNNRDPNDSVAIPNIQLPERQPQDSGSGFAVPNLLEALAVKPSHVEALNEITDPPLQVAQNTFITVKTYDQQLEVTVEGWIENLRIRITNFFN